MPMFNGAGPAGNRVWGRRLGWCRESNLNLNLSFNNKSQLENLKQYHQKLEQTIKIVKQRIHQIESKDL